MAITFVDTETTGLILPEGTDISLQPYFTEICAIQVDEEKDFEIVNIFESFIKPPRPIPKIVVKLNGINDKKVENAPSFDAVYTSLCGVFFGSHTMVAHNLSFDLGMTVIELKRIGKEHAFPYPPIHFCTVEQSMHLKGYRLKNSELYTLATGKEMEPLHRAKHDVLATIESYKFLKGKN